MPRELRRTTCAKALIRSVGSVRRAFHRDSRTIPRSRAKSLKALRSKVRDRNHPLYSVEKIGDEPTRKFIKLHARTTMKRRRVLRRNRVLTVGMNIHIKRAGTTRSGGYCDPIITGDGDVENQHRIKSADRAIIILPK